MTRKRMLGNTIRNARERRGWDRNTLAKKVNISPGYIGHLEYETPVPLSEQLFRRLCKTLGLRPNRLARLVEIQNRRARQYVRARRIR